MQYFDRRTQLKVLKIFALCSISYLKTLSLPIKSICCSHKKFAAFVTKFLHTKCYKEQKFSAFFCCVCLNIYQSKSQFEVKSNPPSFDITECYCSEFLFGCPTLLRVSVVFASIWGKIHRVNSDLLQGREDCSDCF